MATGFVTQASDLASRKGNRHCFPRAAHITYKYFLNYESTKNGVRGAGAFKIRCGELARSRESDWLYLVKILILLSNSN